MAKARARRFVENLRGFEIGVPALVGCLVGSIAMASSGSGQAVIGKSFVMGRRAAALGLLYLNHPMLVMNRRKLGTIPGRGMARLSYR